MAPKKAMKSAMKATAKPKVVTLEALKKPAAAVKAKPMSLDEKLEAFRKRGDPTAKLDVTTEESKRLAGKFDRELAKDVDVQKHVRDAESQAPRGTKQKTHQEFVKARTIAKGFDNMFFDICSKLTHTKSLIYKEKPLSYKQLQEKYTDEEITDLLDSGGITETKHSKRGRVTMYIDHSNWERQKKLDNSKYISSNKRKAASITDVEDWEQAGTYWRSQRGPIPDPTRFVGPRRAPSGLV